MSRYCCVSEQVLSIADVAQHILEFVVVKHLPWVVLDGSVLYVRRIIDRLASMLLMLPLLPNFHADPPQLDLLPGKFEQTIHCVFEKISHLLLVRAVKLVFAH